MAAVDIFISCSLKRTARTRFYLATGGEGLTKTGRTIGDNSKTIKGTARATRRLLLLAPSELGGWLRGGSSAVTLYLAYVVFLSLSLVFGPVFTFFFFAKLKVVCGRLGRGPHHAPDARSGG